MDANGNKIVKLDWVYCESQRDDKPEDRIYGIVLRVGKDWCDVKWRHKDREWTMRMKQANLIVTAELPNGIRDATRASQLVVKPKKKLYWDLDKAVFAEKASIVLGPFDLSARCYTSPPPGQRRVDRGADWADHAWDDLAEDGGFNYHVTAYSSEEQTDAAGTKFLYVTSKLMIECKRNKIMVWVWPRVEKPQKGKNNTLTVKTMGGLSISTPLIRHILYQIKNNIKSGEDEHYSWVWVEEEAG